ncbi:MAG: recombinase RecT [Massilioclostridium sp.]|nr:recombinase RecT [Massilioclostridium sp.]
MAEKINALALAKKTQNIVLEQVKNFEKSGELKFPPNYSPENALKSAWLQIQQTEDNNHHLAIEVCTQNSIANALLSTVIQGLNPDKKQVYYIVYGKKLVAQRSYFGAIAVAKQVNSNVKTFNAQVVYEGDELEYEIKNGKKYITKHAQKFQDINKAAIVGAYCIIEQHDGDNYAIVMTMDEIKQAWQQSKMNVFDNNGELNSKAVHSKFTASMACKTVTNRACKHIINTSDDANIVSQFAKTADAELAKAEAEATIEKNANKGDFIDVEGVEIDEETGELLEGDDAAPEQGCESEDESNTMD